ncbi:hypothetical protein A7U60_g3523 [Sanghuangporus baumii]|uniref:Uncharacterized protein n=1 Tax=Sanghuangporus baumii TaxID=108892 RepID=A0A9Q5I0A2_SANBA|nr:hypothetical protein A7U60_g3523 [Sanghuangporus baumii]
MTLVRRSLVTESTEQIFIFQYYSLASVVLLSLRTYALYNRSWKVLCFVSLLGLSTIITSAWTISGVFGILVSFGLAGGGGGVFRTCISGQVKATTFLSAIFDGIVFLLTFIRTLQIVRQNKKSGARADLPHLLMRDGSIYFAVMIVANLVIVIIFSDRSIPSTEFAQSTGNNAMLSHVISVTMISRLVLNLHGFEDRKREAVIHPHRIPHHVDLHANGTRLDDMTCETSFTGEEISQDATQLTTQISVYSIWHTRVMEGFGGDATVYEKNDFFSASPSDASTVIDESTSSHSAHSDDEPAWLDEDDDSQQSEISSIPREGNDLSGVKRFSDGHAVWWAE